ncbi:MAG: alpha-ribazole phosphatase [Candidatus Omnitrophica bacterium]|nr:alpha-ribazole phosphatase [Candidatus Omnitrophota bacterium]
MHTKLIMIRHGQTDWSIEKRYCGRTDIPLNNTGRKQAAELRGLLRGEKIDAVYASKLRRAHEFAGIVFEKLPILATEELCEMNFGIFEGLTYDEIMQKYPGIYSKWIENPGGTDIPGGESMRDFKKRIETVFEKIIGQGGNKTLAVITHAGVIKILLSDILKIGNIWKAQLEWGAISAIMSKGGKGDKWVRLPLF